MKDLGVMVDEKLKFHDHIHEKVNKAYSMLGIIKRNFKDMDNLSFLYLYKSLVRSIVEYNSSVWSPSYMGQIEELEKVQRRATKLVRGCRNLPYVERLKYLKLPTLRFRRCRGDMIETYKLLTHRAKNNQSRPVKLASLAYTLEQPRKDERKRIMPPAAYRQAYLSQHSYLPQKIKFHWSLLTFEPFTATALSQF